MNFDNNIPIYIQIVEKLKIYIISGKLSLGERLSSVRDLALLYKANPNTIQKALSELEDLNLIYTERTNGKFVTNDKKLIDRYKKEYADNLVKKFISNMEDIGFTKEDATNYLMKGDK